MTKQVENQCTTKVDLNELLDDVSLNKELFEYLKSRKKETPKIPKSSDQGEIDRAI